MSLDLGVDGSDCPRCGFATPLHKRCEVEGSFDWECDACAFNPVVGLDWGQPFIRIGDELRHLTADEIDRLIHELQCARGLV